jgi:hypothetical protein
MARLTFTPPPPGSNRLGPHRSLCSGTIRSTVLDTSSAGFMVSVTIGACADMT